MSSKLSIPVAYTFPGIWNTEKLKRKYDEHIYVTGDFFDDGHSCITMMDGVSFVVTQKAPGTFSVEFLYIPDKETTPRKVENIFVDVSLVLSGDYYVYLNRISKITENSVCKYSISMDVYEKYT